MYNIQIENLGCYILSLVWFIKRKLQKMELRLHHIIHLYNVFRENDGKENCAQLIEEEFYEMFGIMMSMIAMLLV